MSGRRGAGRGDIVGRPAGYSETPLLAKLGYAAGQRACLIAVPASVPELLVIPKADR